MSARGWLSRLLPWARVMRGQPGGPRIIMVPRTIAGVRVDHDTAFKSSVVWACVRVVSETLAMLPWEIYARTANDEREKIGGSPIRALLSVQPNPETTAFHFRRTLMAHALTWGNGYAEIELDGGGRPQALWTLEPDRVVPRRDESGALVYEIWSGSGQKTILPANRVLHVPGLGFDGVTGYSVISYAAQSIGLALAADIFGTSFFASGGALCYVFTHPGTLNPEAHKNLEASLNAKISGAKSLTWLVTEEGMKAEVLGAPLKDAKLPDVRQQQIADICRWFRVPPHKVADLSRATFSNIEHQSIDFVIDGVMPWAVLLEQEVNRKLLGPGVRDRLFSKINLNALLRGDTAARSAFYTAMLDRGVFSINQVLRLEDMNGIGPDGDKRMVPRNMTTLAKLGEDPIPPSPPREGVGSGGATDDPDLLDLRGKLAAAKPNSAANGGMTHG